MYRCVILYIRRLSPQIAFQLVGRNSEVYIVPLHPAQVVAISSPTGYRYQPLITSKGDEERLGEARKRVEQVMNRVSDFVTSKIMSPYSYIIYAVSIEAQHLAYPLKRLYQRWLSDPIEGKGYNLLNEPN